MDQTEIVTYELPAVIYGQPVNSFSLISINGTFKHGA